jgi:hypothetical protein
MHPNILAAPVVKLDPPGKNREGGREYRSDQDKLHQMPDYDNDNEKGLPNVTQGFRTRGGGSCEHGCIEGGAFPGYLSDHWLFMKASAPWTYIRATIHRHFLSALNHIRLETTLAVSDVIASRRLHTATAQVWSQVISSWTCSGQSGTEGEFSTNTSAFLANFHSVNCTIIITHNPYGQRGWNNIYKQKIKRNFPYQNVSGTVWRVEFTWRVRQQRYLPSSARVMGCYVIQVGPLNSGRTVIRVKSKKKKK